MSSAENSCKLFKPIFAYRLRPLLLFAKMTFLKSQADDKADDDCCYWQFKGQVFTIILFLSFCIIALGKGLFFF